MSYKLQPKTLVCRIQQTWNQMWKYYSPGRIWIILFTSLFINLIECITLRLSETPRSWLLKLSSHCSQREFQFFHPRTQSNILSLQRSIEYAHLGSATARDHRCPFSKIWDHIRIALLGAITAFFFWGKMSSCWSKMPRILCSEKNPPPSLGQLQSKRQLRGHSSA